MFPVPSHCLEKKTCCREAYAEFEECASAWFLTSTFCHDFPPLSPHAAKSVAHLRGVIVSCGEERTSGSSITRVTWLWRPATTNPSVHCCSLGWGASLLDRLFWNFWILFQISSVLHSKILPNFKVEERLYFLFSVPTDQENKWRGVQTDLWRDCAQHRQNGERVHSVRDVVEARGNVSQLSVTLPSDSKAQFQFLS